jgi:tRNA (guanine9-N1)-methyltransferase
MEAQKHNEQEIQDNQHDESQERDSDSSYSGDGSSSYSSSVETDLKEEQSLKSEQVDPTASEEFFDNPFFALQPAQQKAPRQQVAPPAEALRPSSLPEDLRDNCPLKSLKARKKRKAQRQRRQGKRKEVLVSMNRDERILFIRDEREQKKEAAARLKEKLLAGQISKLRVVIDCEFEGKMSERENKSLISQLKFIYSRIKKSAASFNITITGFGGKLASLVDYHNVRSWEFNWESRTLLELLEAGVIPKESAVYLSPDAPDELSEITSEQVWIIGGLVDGTVIKDATKTKAEELGIKAKRLNVTQFKGNTSFRNCLNVNDVFNIVTGCLEGHKLQDMIISNMPKRMKEAQ